MTYEYKGLTIAIETDDPPESPRSWDNIGTMVCFHNRYFLGDKGHGYEQEGFSSWAELEKEIREREGQDAIILPLWLYDHSEISMSCGARRYPYDCQWDSGQVGFIFVRMGDVKKEWLNSPLTPEEKEAAAEELLKSEVELYDKFLRGEVMGYTIKDEEGSVLDSCFGFYGLEDCKEQAESMADWHVKDREENGETIRHEETARQISLCGF